jgi:hypothetical protein
LELGVWIFRGWALPAHPWALLAHFQSSIAVINERGINQLYNAMKSIIFVSALISWSCCQAQTYSIDWFTIDGGGGTSTGSVYSVSGTVGQPDAGHMSGGNFTLDGGFWGIISAVQTVGAPTLTIQLTATNTITVSWPSPSTGFNLQHNADLTTATWVTPSETVTDNGTLKFIIVNPPAGNRFYRLSKP